MQFHNNLFTDVFGFWFFTAEISLALKIANFPFPFNPDRETSTNSIIIKIVCTVACLIAIDNAKERSQLFLLLPEDLPIDQGGDEGGEEGGGAGEGDAGEAACLEKIVTRIDKAKKK